MKRSRALKQLRELEKHKHKLRLAAEGWNKPWQNLISTMLSARTRDEVTIDVCNKLFKKYKIVKSLTKASLKDIQKVIRPVNFYKNKSKNVLACAKILNEQYGGKPPLDFDKLIKLPGVGRKTTNVFLSEMGKHTIGVDTHVSYISQKLGWAKHSKPEKIEEDLKKLFSRKDWRRVNPVLVQFGRTHKSKRLKDKLLNKIKKIT